jgi:hypothetical protein
LEGFRRLSAAKRFSLSLDPIRPEEKSGDLVAVAEHLVAWYLNIDAGGATLGLVEATENDDIRTPSRTRKRHANVKEDFPIFKSVRLAYNG